MRGAELGGEVREPRRREGRKLGSREGLSISHCSTGVFKYHHRVWLRHGGWESSADQRLFKQLSLLSFSIFVSSTVKLWFCLVRDSLAQLESFETMKGERNPNEKLIITLHKEKNVTVWFACQDDCFFCLFVFQFYWFFLPPCQHQVQWDICKYSAHMF